MTQHRRRPVLPWMKDETVGPFASLTNAQALRILIFALVAFVVVVGVGAFYLIDEQSQISDLTRQNATATSDLRDVTDQIEAIQKRNHASRLADQQRTDRQLRQLACVIVSQVNEDAAKYPATNRRAVKQFRAYYHCPPYSARGAANPLPGRAAPLPTPTPAPPAATPSVHAAPTLPTATATPGVAHSSQPIPSPTKPTSGTTPSPTTSPTTTPAPIRSAVCAVLNVVGLCRTEKR